jgi:hypothetical protein
MRDGREIRLELSQSDFVLNPFLIPWKSSVPSNLYLSQSDFVLK